MSLDNILLIPGLGGSSGGNVLTLGGEALTLDSEELTLG